MSPPDGSYSYATARGIALDALSAFLPPVRYNVAQYAAKHRHLNNPGGGYSGPWQHEKVPYLVEPMECLTGKEFLTVAVTAPGQSGKTSIAENWFLYSVACDPANFLWYMQTEDAILGYVKDRIGPMIDDHPEIRERLGLNAEDDTQHYKRFHGMSVEFLSATVNNLINKSKPRIIADEIDAYLDTLGDVKARLDIRRQSFGRASKILAISHPDKARGLDPDKDWTAGIMAIYADSTRCVWWWPCPHCGAFSSPIPTAQRYMSIEYPVEAPFDVIERETYLKCPVNGCIVEDHHRAEMNKRGVWVGEGQEITQDGLITGQRVRRDTAGYWIVGAMSPFIIGGIGSLAKARVKAERECEITNEDKTLREVIVKGWGIPYSAGRRVGTFKANDLANRCVQHLQLGIVPDGVRFLTAFVDVQSGRFEFLVRGWGISGESWIIDRGRILAEPDTNPSDWDKLLTEVFLKTYPLEDGSKRVMAIRGCGFDSHGQAGVTQQARATWVRWQKNGTLRCIGKGQHGPIYTIIPTKGLSSINASRLAVTFPDTQRNANKMVSRGVVPQAGFNPNLYKDDLFGQLSRFENGPLCIHFAWDLREAEPPHPFFEQIVSEQRDRKGRWDKITPNLKNEALDMMVGCHVIADLWGLSRIDWDRPPSWAAAWERNTLISMPTIGPKSETTLADRIKAINAKLAH